MEVTYQASVVFIIAFAVAYTLLRVSKDSPITTDQLEDEYHYIIVGAGSAGSVVAARLSEDKDKKVLLLEAGGHYKEDPNYQVPAYAGSLQNTEYDWGYFTKPQKVSQLGLKDSRSYIAAGKILGGSNMLNNLQYARGSRFDYDEWAQNGCTGWSYSDVLPYFLKADDLKSDELKSSNYHSSGGPLAVRIIKENPLVEHYMKAGLEAGYDITDYNGETQEGFNYMQLNIRNGIRSTSAAEYLGSTADRTNLHIALRSFVTKIEIKNKRAVGVYVIRNMKKQFIKAKNEIIISAGAINSPQLLMLSGIGPKEHLEKFGIQVKVDLPVGQNLQSHQIVTMFSKINTTYGITENVKESLWSKLSYNLFGTGPLSITIVDGSAFFHINNSNTGNTSPDIQFMFASLFPHINFFNFKDEIGKELLAKDPNQHGFTTFISITRPRSVGYVKLRSSDPFDYPIFDPQFLTEETDVKNFIAGIRIWEKIMKTPTIKALGVRIDQLTLSLCSQHKFSSDAYWECLIRHIAVPMFHQSGTCKMGAVNDPQSVVDPKLRVKGITGLRVVDASILPNVTAGNTNAIVIKVAEKISDEIRGTDSVRDIRNKLKRST